MESIIDRSGKPDWVNSEHNEDEDTVVDNQNDDDDDDDDDNAINENEEEAAGANKNKNAEAKDKCDEGKSESKYDDEDDNQSDSDILQNDYLVKTLRLCAEQQDLDQLPTESEYVIDDSVFNKLYHDVFQDELDSDSESEIFKTQTESKHFIGSTAEPKVGFNPLSHNNYNLIKKKGKNGKIKWMVTLRHSIGMIASYTESMLETYGIRNDVWHFQNKDKVDKVKEEIRKIKSRMKQGKEFRDIPKTRIRKYCGKYIDNFNNYFAATIITDQGKYLSILYNLC